MSRRRRRRYTQVVNIIPLVDVLIVLIFFFLMTVQFQDKNVMNITPPKVETAGENKATDEILIAINKEGEFFYNNELVEAEALEQLLKLAAGVDGTQSILVIADEDAKFKDVTFVMDASRKVKLEAIRIQTR